MGSVRTGWLTALGLGACAAAGMAWTPVGPGIEYQEFHLPDPNNVFVARMERDEPQCTIESSIGQGRLSGGTETIGSQADRYDDAIGYWHRDWGRRRDVVVAINGDFYNTSTGVPASGQVISGWFAKEYIGSAFAWSMERSAALRNGLLLDQKVTYPATGVTRTADGINRPRGSNELIIYTPHYDRDTGTDDSAVEVLVELTRPMLMVPASAAVRGTVREIHESQGATPIPFDHVVLSASGTDAPTLLADVSVGSAVELWTGGSSASSWTNSYASVGGGEVFLRNGVIYGGQYLLHPRTAVAFNDMYVFFIVVDGRNPGVSIGMNMDQLAEFCVDHLQADSGINLDGGGSSTMIVNGVLRNDPSDGSQRRVSNGLMMVALQPKTQSTLFNVGDQVRTTTASNVRLGPGTNHAVLTSVSSNTQGLILDHSLRGIRAKGYDWWKCDFSGTVGWVAETLLTRVESGDGPVITQHTADQDICEGGVAVFSVAATGTGAVSYQWQFNGAGLADGEPYSGTTTPALTVSDFDQEHLGSYRCVVTDDVGTATSYSAALLPPRPPTVITQQPEPLDWPLAVHGSTASFAVAAAGDGAITYRWQKDTADLADDGHYVGTTTAELTIDHVSSEDEGDYRCRITANCGAVLSDAAALAVTTPDFDGDGDVDQGDFARIQFCLSGTANPAPTECWDTRLDGDRDVDGNDVRVFLPCLTGPGQPYDPHCLDWYLVP